MITLKYPVKLKIEAVELEDGSWKLSYEEHFREEDLEAFKASYQFLGKATPFKTLFDEERCCIEVEIVGPRGVVFDYLCGEFFALSRLAQKTLQELFVLAGIGAHLMKEGKSKASSLTNKEEIQ